MTDWTAAALAWLADHPLHSARHVAAAIGCSDVPLVRRLLEQAELKGLVQRQRLGPRDPWLWERPPSA